MAQDVYLDAGSISTGILRNSKRELDDVQRKLNQARNCPTYHSPDGYKALFPYSMMSELELISGRIRHLEEKLNQYERILSSGPDALAAVDASVKSGPQNYMEMIRNCFDTLPVAVLQGALGLFSLLFGTGDATAGVTDLYQIENVEEKKQNNGAEKPETVSAADKRKIISEYETENPEAAQKLNDYLDDTELSKSDVENIKYLVYTAPEPYRSLYLDHTESYKLKLKSRGTSNHNRITNTTTLVGEEGLSSDPRSPYTTFFHESGHAVDDFESGIVINPKKAYRSSQYEYQDKSLFECISGDVRDNVSRYIDSEYSDLTQEQKHTLLRSMNLTDDADFIYRARDNGLSDPYLDKIRTEVLDYYVDEELVGYANNAVCDVYGGITNEVFFDENVYKDGVYLGHMNDSEYWYKKTFDFGYLGGNYDIKTGEFIFDMGDQTGRQASELWASFFAAQMTRNEAALANIKEHFPTAYEAMEQMARDMAST